MINIEIIDLLAGSTSQETDLYAPRDIALWTKFSMYHKLNMGLSKFNYTDEETKHFYPFHHVEETYTTLCTDIRQTCLANMYARLGSTHLPLPVYRYVVTHKPSSARMDSGFNAAFASHGLDILAFFQSLENNLVTMHLSDDDRNFQENIKHNVLSFVRSGSLDDQRWTSATNTTALIGKRVEFVHGTEYQNPQCFHWKRLQQYAWKG